MDFHPSLRDVHPSHEFWLRDGPKLKNLYELEHELRKMTDAQFLHHVNDAKNDFYNWIFHVVKDAKLSEQLAQVKAREAMADIIERHIQLLEKPVKSVKVKKVVKKVQTQIPTRKALKAKPIKLEKIEIPKVEIPKVTMPQIVELPLVPAIAPIPLSFEEVEERIRKKVGPMPEIAQPHFELSVSHVHADHKPLHHRIHHHVKKHAVHYGIIAGVLLGLFFAKYFL